MKLQVLLGASEQPLNKQLGLFGLLALGVIESLASGAVSAADAVRAFFNADNCLFVRKQLRKKSADEVMSRGIQLADLFDALAPEEAYRELQRELSAMRSLCLKFVEGKHLVA